MNLKVKRLSDAAVLPRYAHAGDAGLDLFAAMNLVLAPGDAALVRTGIAIELPPGYEAQIRPRSGLALRHGLSLVNTPGLIDAGYRGEIRVIVINHDREAAVTIARGDRIAQLVIQRIETVDLVEVDKLPDTSRGTGGFGSTGS
jgi:dUTP pyrophosphatase